MRTIVSNLLEDSVRHLRVAVDEARREPQPKAVKIRELLDGCEIGAYLLRKQRDSLVQELRHGAEAEYLASLLRQIKDVAETGAKMRAALRALALRLPGTLTEEQFALLETFDREREELLG